MPGLNGILVIGVPVYTVLLTTMAWRAISRVQFYKVQRKVENKMKSFVFTRNTRCFPVFWNFHGSFGLLPAFYLAEN